MKTRGIFFLLAIITAGSFWTAGTVWTAGLVFAADKILLVTGVEHSAHPWQQTAPILQKLLADAGMDVVRTDDYTSVADTDLTPYKAVILHFQNANPSEKDKAVLDKLEAFTKNGGGLVLTHFAIGSFQMCDQFKRIVGRVWNPNLRSHDPFGTFEMKPVPMTPLHPIAEGLPSTVVEDELYTCTDGTDDYEVIAAAASSVDSITYPLVYIHRFEKGRAVTILLGHDTRSVRNPDYGKWFVRCVQCASGQINDSVDTGNTEQTDKRNKSSQNAMVNMVPLPDSERIQQLTNETPEGEKLVGYMNCGSYPASLFGSVQIRLLSEKLVWNFLNNPIAVSTDGVKLADLTTTPKIDTTVFYGKTLEFKLTGIDRTKKYRLCAKCWDFDKSGRNQGLYFLSPDRRMVRRTVDPVALPNFLDQGSGPAIRSVLIPSSYSRNGELLLTFPLAGGANAVVSEIWIYPLP